jgi:hypothetical protein
MKAVLLLLAASVASAADNKTSAFLGPVDDWPKCRIVLEDIQGLWGGTAIHLDAAGPCILRIVDRGKERRFEMKQTPDETKALRTTCIDADLLTVKIKERMGVPDEARPTIILTNAKGKTFSLAKWANDKVPRFDKVYNALLDLKKKTKDVDPVYEGNWQRDWKPKKQAATKESFKGWELYVWEKDRNTYYSLMVGTNRLKSDAEITRAAVKGLDAIKPKLDELKPGQSVFIWGPRLGQQADDVAKAVRKYCREIGLKAG